MPGVVDGHELPREWKACSCVDENSAKASGEQCCGQVQIDDDLRYCDDKEKCYKNKNCGCNLFKRLKTGDGNWHHVAGPGKDRGIPSTLDPDHHFACICVEKVETKRISPNIINDIGRLLIDIASFDEC
jgi:hypothetical protein